MGMIECLDIDPRGHSVFKHIWIIHTFIHSHYPRVLIFYHYYYSSLFSRHYCLFRLTSSVISIHTSTFSSFDSNRFMLLINSIVYFIVCGSPNDFATFSLPFPISFIIFFLCSSYLRHSNR